MTIAGSFPRFLPALFLVHRLLPRPSPPPAISFRPLFPVPPPPPPPLPRCPPPSPLVCVCVAVAVRVRLFARVRAWWARAWQRCAHVCACVSPCVCVCECVFRSHSARDVFTYHLWVCARVMGLGAGGAACVRAHVMGSGALPARARVCNGFGCSQRRARPVFVRACACLCVCVCARARACTCVRVTSAAGARVMRVGGGSAAPDVNVPADVATAEEYIRARAAPCP